MSEHKPPTEAERCPKCGGTEWSTASDGLGALASVATVCHGCGYMTATTVDLSISVTDEGAGDE